MGNSFNYKRSAAAVIKKATDQKSDNTRINSNKWNQPTSIAAATEDADDTVQAIEPCDLDAQMHSDEYLMLSKLFVFNEVCESDSYGIKRYKNCLYKGQLAGKKRDGLGVLMYANGRVYEGEWKQEKR